MWEFLKNLRDFLGLDYRSLFIVACICWIIVIIPASTWQTLQLLNLWIQLRPWLFGVGLLATTWLVSGGLYDLAKLSFGKWSEKRDSNIKKIAREQLLLSSSRVEKEVLARYIADDTTTIAFEMRDGIVNGLVAKGILYRSSQGSNPMSYDFDTNIQTWVWEFIKNHPEFLQGITPITTGRHQWHL